MENYNATFLVGGPGSGKDFLLRTALKESGATEIPLAKLITAIQTNQNLEEVDGRPLIVNGNADDGQSILLAKAVLEAMEYQTALIHVYTSEYTSKARSKIDEEKRASKYLFSCQNMHIMKDVFGEGFFLFNNSGNFIDCSEEIQSQMILWISELRTMVEGYFEKPVLGIRAPKVPKPVGGVPKGGHPVPAGHERVKDGSFNVIRKKQDETPPAGVREEVDVLFEKEFPTIVDMIAQKKVKGQSQGDKYKGGISVAGNKATSREVVESRKKPEGFKEGDSARFSGRSADGSVSGDMDVKIVNPHSNADKITHTDKSGRHYEGAHSHIATATVERPERKGAFPAPAKRFEAHHHTLQRKLAESNQEVSVPQTQAKGVKYSKNRPAKGAKPPGDYFDGRMGAVPSGGIGLTAYKEEVTPKPLSKIRRK